MSESMKTGGSTDDFGRAMDIFDHAVENAPWNEKLVEMIACDIKHEGMDPDCEVDAAANDIERLTGAVVALCNVSAMQTHVLSQGVAVLERIAAALERAYPPAAEDKEGPR